MSVCDNQCANDLEIGRLADMQHGVVAARQLALSKESVSRRVRAGRLRRLHRGVYAVGHTALKPEGRWMAAVLAVGADAVLSHTTAAAAWDLRRADGAIHVTLPRDTGRRRRAGLRIHRAQTLTPRETATVRGIPVTSPARTIADLARTVSGRPLERLLDRADLLGLVDFAELRTIPRTPSLQAVLSRYAAGSAVTRSEMEDAFLTLCDRHHIPRPATNTRVEGGEADFVWREQRLIVEVDGYAYHRSPGAFEDDRERDVLRVLAGWHVMRFTWTQLTRRPRWVAGAVSRRLALCPFRPLTPGPASGEGRAHG